MRLNHNMITYHHLNSIVLLCLLLSVCFGHPALGHNNVSTLCHDDEREVLLEFKNSLTDDCGLLDSWVGHSDCCRWNGVTCSNRTGHVIMLDLEGDDADSRCLTGRVSPSLANLSQLSYLSLSYNNLEGSIPGEFQNMTSLTYLDLYENHLQGSVSKTLGKLCSLKQLYLGSNNFTDELKNVIQDLLGCENKPLELLDLSRNHFWGDVPDSVSSFSSLMELHLDGNQLMGEIPQGIGQLTMLQSLDISSNSLEGTLTQTHFSNLSRLSKLYLFGNKRLVISIDASWIPPFELDIISLSSCTLGPSFPKWLQTQTNFLYLDISNAGISDRVPASFWNSMSSKLTYLDMSNNQFYGLIPNLPENISLMMNLDLSSNLFEGAVPSRFINTLSLYLNDNRFSDASQILCPKNKLVLEELDLSNNLLFGELPDCWMNFDGLQSLHLENNRFSGSIPKSIGSLQSLQYLHLNNNSSLPASFQNCTSLNILNLGYNSFTGYIPPWFGNATTSLGALILRRNNFRGVLPLSLCQLSKLQILDLAMNNISGRIPKCIQNLTSMSQNTGFLGFSIAISDVGFQPVETQRESALVTWKREVQRFKGSIGLVRSVDLSQNELHGKIPEGITRLVELVSLDLSGNKLSGNIPLQIGNLTALEFLDLSNNHLTGEIPASLAKISSLKILDVSNNNLSGEIPVSTQIQSFNATSYTGNLGLCGGPLLKCLKDQAHTSASLNTVSSTTHQDEHDEDYGIWLYISVLLGFIIGFWGVYGTFVIKRSWRHAFFKLLYAVKHWFY